MPKSYLVVYVKAKGENGGWMGSSPDVLRCVSAGDNHADMRAHMLEALEGHLAWMAQDGDILIEKLTVSVPETATFSVTAEEAVLA